MRTVLRLLALLAGFLALPVAVAVACSRLDFAAAQSLTAAVFSFPLSTSATLIVSAAFTKARRTVAEARRTVAVVLAS